MRKFSMLAAICALLALTGATYGAIDYTWDGDTSTNWSEGQNWDQDNGSWPGDANELPDSADDTALIPFDASGYPVLSESLEIASLTMRDGTAANASVDITVDNGITLTIDGLFRVGSTAAVSSYVERLGPGSMIPDSMTVLGGDGSGEFSTYLHSAGTLRVVGEMKCEEGTYTTDNSDLATFQYDAAATDVKPNSVRLVGKSLLDLNETMNVDGEFRLQLKGASDYSGQPNVDLAANVELKCETFYIDATHAQVDFQPTLAGGAKIVTASVSF